MQDARKLTLRLDADVAKRLIKTRDPTTIHLLVDTVAAVHPHHGALIAERGRSFRPRLVTGIRGSDGRVTAFAPIEEKPVEGISQEDWTTVINAMIGTTTCARYCGTGSTAFAKSDGTPSGHSILVVCQGASITCAGSLINLAY